MLNSPGYDFRAPFAGTLLLAAALVAGCGGSTIRPEDVSAGASASSAGDYTIGPGDTLDVFVWRQPDLSVTVPVRPDGRISTPLVEDVEAVGKTPTELANEIEMALAEYIRTPEVNVIVQDFVGAAGNQIRVLGQAAEPTSVAYREGMTLMDVMLQVGGLSEFAAGNRGRVVRSANGETREIRVRIDDLINEGALDQNVTMRPGDVVVIPEAVF